MENRSYIFKVKIDEPGDAFVLKQLRRKQPEICLRQPVCFIGGLRHSVPAQAVHRHRNHPLEKVQQVPPRLMFEHGQQSRVHEFQLLPDTRPLPGLGAEDYPGRKLIPVMVEIVLDLTRGDFLPELRGVMSLNPRIPALFTCNVK